MLWNNLVVNNLFIFVTNFNSRIFINLNLLLLDLRQISMNPILKQFSCPYVKWQSNLFDSFHVSSFIYTLSVCTDLCVIDALITIINTCIQKNVMKKIAICEQWCVFYVLFGKSYLISSFTSCVHLCGRLYCLKRFTLLSFYPFFL